MIDMDDGLDRDDEDMGMSSSRINKKKILMIILPAIIIIGLVVSFYAVFSSDKKADKNYSVVTNSNEDGTSAQTVIFYDMPEIVAILKNRDDSTATVKLKISLETSDLSEDKINALEALSSKINDIIIAHLVELSPAEITDSEGLYWLKEELLYRVNLVTDPIKINSINFKNFEIQNDHQ